MTDQPMPELPPLPATVARSEGPTKTSRLAVASLVLGVLSCPLSIFAGIPGLVCGIMGLNRISRSERAAASPRLTGQGMAIAGVILCGISTFALPVMVALMLPAVQAARESGRQMACLNNLRGIALAMHMHNDATHLFPAAITDADGKPLLSWRVAILPFVEELALYNEFHLDEPWDSPHNLALVPRMPEIYACPSAGLDAGKTRYLLLDGPGSAFEQSKLRAGEGDHARVWGTSVGALDGFASTTIMVVEAPADRAVAWTKPEDLSVSPAEAAGLEDQAGHAGGIRNAAFMDGSVGRLDDDR